MNKTAGWESAQAYDGTYRKLPPGGYVCVIKDARVEAGQYGEQMIVALDVCEGEYAGFFGDLYEAKRKAPGAALKWPCVYYQSLLNRDGVTNGFFKGLITSVERSNVGYVWSWDERTLKGKKVGFVFGEEDWMDSNGNVRTSTKPKTARDVKAILDGDFAVPPKKLAGQQSSGYIQVESPASNGGFEQVDDELPF